MVSFMLRPLFVYPFIMRLDDPQSQSGRFGVWKNVLSVPEIEPPNLSRPPCTLVDIPTEF